MMIMQPIQNIELNQLNEISLTLTSVLMGVFKSKTQHGNITFRFFTATLYVSFQLKQAVIKLTYLFNTEYINFRITMFRVH